MENGKLIDKAQKNEVAERDSERDKALAAAMAQIEKQFGKGSVMKLGDRADKASVSAISTGSLSLDAALGIGGLPRGRIVEIDRIEADYLEGAT
jgi:recombination protein RecA